MTGATGFVVLPAVDVAAGRAVRPTSGGRAGARPSEDPVELALRYQRAGADWIHLVDLDAAFGRGSNSELLANVVRRLEVSVQLSGGIRDEEALGAAMRTGAARVVLGTTGVADRRWLSSAIDRYGDRVAVALDVRGDRLAPRGWPAPGGALLEAVEALDADGASRYVVTDVTRDGTLAGPDLALLRRLGAVTDRAIVASGGVGSLAHLRSLVDLRRVEGAVIGGALAAGAFELPDALAVAWE